MGMEERIEQALDEKVRPILKGHGGQVEFMEYQEGKVLIKLTGACAGCPSANLGTKQFIEETLCKEIDEVEKVELSQSVSDDLLTFARRILS